MLKEDEILSVLYLRSIVRIVFLSMPMLALSSKYSLPQLPDS